MTTANRVTPETPDTESAYSTLRSQLGAMHGVEATYDGVTGDTEAVRRLVKRWLPLATARLEAAEGSPSDQDRWQALIDAPQHDTGFLRESSAARGLLRALMEASLPGPTAREIADRLRREIADGTRPPGSVVSRVRILADAGLASATDRRVELAVQDLVAENLLVVGSANRVRVAGPGEAPCDHRVPAAGLLRALVSGGVYSPMSSLPTRRDLAKILAVGRPVVGQVLRQLHDEKVLSVPLGAGAVVRPLLPFPVSEPPALQGLAARLRAVAPSGTDLDHAGIRKMCRRARVWWHHGSAPGSESLRAMRQVLVAAAADLLPLAAHRHPDDPAVCAVLRRTAVTALHTWPEERDTTVWRTACLATAVLETLGLADGVA